MTWLTYELRFSVVDKTGQVLEVVWSSGFSCVFSDTTSPVRAAEVWSRAADTVTGFVNKSLNSIHM